MRQVINGVIIAALMIGVSLLLPWLNHAGYISGDRAEISQRGFNVMMGLLVIGMANMAPKRMKPLAEMACDPVREQSSRRFSSWVIVAGGLLYCVAWAAAPMAIALPLSIAALGGAMTIVLAQCLLFAQRR